jgi:hypothetical protein
MKKSLLFLFPALLALGACAPATSSSSEDDPFAVDKVTVYFFVSAVNVDEKNPFLSYEVELGSKLTAPTSNPETIDPAFNTFLGWSNKPFIMNDDEYWNFEEDKIPTYIPNLKFYMYGQWDYIA